MKNLPFNKIFAKAFLILASVSIIGCSAANQEIQGLRDPRESYDKAMAAYLGERYEEAEKEFRGLMDDHPLSPYAVEAELMLGDVCYATEKYDDASSYYTNFIALHPTHPRASYALFQKGMSHFKDILSLDRDQTSTRKALFAFEDLLAAYPASSYTGKAKELSGFLRRRLADREFYVGSFYFKGKNYKGALARFRDILKDYPEVGITDAALFYIGESYAKLGETVLAKEAYTAILNTYPDSPYAGDARSRLGEG